MKNSKENPVSVHYGEDGKADGILVQTLDDSFIIGLHDAEDSSVMIWNKAIGNYKAVMPDKRRTLLICYHLDEINKLLKEAGGDPLNKWYWTQTEYSTYAAWFFSGYGGCVLINYKYYASSVRPVLASV